MKYLQGRVLEVGAGMGATTSLLCSGKQERWLCLEPDPNLAAALQSKIRNGEVPSCCEARTGTLSDLPAELRFDTLLYLDVLEHILDDRGELQEAVRRLNESGNLIVVAPAFFRLFSAFDSKLGHFRRYTKKTIAAIAPEQLEIMDLRYLDSLGLFCSLFNRHILQREKPTRGQILFWDKYLVSLSRYLDPLLHYAWGRSLVAIWRKCSS
jgi:SAM-dependent methyltransferase